MPTDTLETLPRDELYQATEDELNAVGPVSLAGRTDQASATTDYEAVVILIRNLVNERPRKLIEAIADELAEAILSRRLADRVTIEVKKFSIPDTQFVAVRITRTQ